MVKYTDSKELQLKVEVFVGGEDGSAIYIDRPILYDSTGDKMLLTPQEARLRNLTYQMNLYADLLVRFTQDDSTQPISTTFDRVLLGSIPIMVHSDPCILHGQGTPILRELHEDMFDAGGYFIIDGKEKVIVSQERITTNRLFISRLEDDPNFNLKAFIRCTSLTGEAALIPRTIEFYVINNPDTMMGDPEVKGVYRSRKGAILVRLPSVKGYIPIALLFRALGVESDKSILEHILGDDVEQQPSSFLNFLRPSLYQYNVINEEEDDKKSPIYTQARALELLKNYTHYKSNDHIRSILSSEILPNVSGDFSNKARYLGYLVNQIMKVALGIDQPSDRDGYVFKRVDISGFLLAQLFQETYNRLRKSCRDMIDREYYYGPWKNTGDIKDIVRVENLHRLFNPSLMTEVFVRSLKGMWGTATTQDPDQRPVQDLSRISYIGTMSHVRRVNLPLDRSIKVTSPHRLHPQQWGVMCPFESPDGASIGYLKNFALLTHITFGVAVDGIHKAVADIGAIPIHQMPPATSASKHVIKLFINGDWYGVVPTPNTFVKYFRLLRRNGLINPFASISWDIPHNEIRIQTEAGRPCRPVVIVENGSPLLSAKHASLKWFDLILGGLLPENQRTEEAYYKSDYISPFSLSDFRGLPLEDVMTKLEGSQCVIEFLDIEEENTRFIAMDVKDIHALHTHLEIHPSTIFSVVTNNIPFANHNFAPRNCFYGSQSKQAIGVYASNFTRRFDTMGYIQHYPQKPIISTRISHYTGNDRMPNGFNAIVAIATHTGFNQEDAIIINKSAIDRGMFQITAYKSMSASEKVVSEGESIMFANPAKLVEEGQKVSGIRSANYTLLDDSGFIKEESYIPRGQEACAVGCVQVSRRLVNKKVGITNEQVVETTYRDISLVTDVHHYGKVDRVYVGHKGVGDNQRICKVRFRKVRRPELGDKCVSRCAQKGVIGMILAHENMPFTKDGLVPDLIINPHAFPSRMTIAHLIECVFAKLCTYEGMLGDGTVFLPFDKEDMFERLGAHGIDKYGNEILYNGRTGEMIPTEIFFGPTFYMRLKHMVTDKVHARGVGPKVQLTHQPTSGRSKQGGLRIGEMERDVIIGHGMSSFIQEAMMEKADKYEWAVCKQCGTLAKYAPTRKIFGCMSCDTQELTVIQTPYAFKLLIQELEAMGIQMRLSAQAFEDATEDEFEEDEEQSGGRNLQPGSIMFTPPPANFDEQDDLEKEEEEEELAREEEEEQEEEEEHAEEAEAAMQEELNTMDEGTTVGDMWNIVSENSEDPLITTEEDEAPEMTPTEEKTDVVEIKKEPEQEGGDKSDVKVIHIDMSSSKVQRKMSNDDDDEMEVETDEFFTEP